MAERFPTMAVTIRVGDLVSANMEMARRIREEVETEIARRAQDIGDRLIPAAEARAMLGNPNPSTMYRWEHDKGYLTTVKIGDRNYYRASDLERIIQVHIPTKH